MDDSFSIYDDMTMDGYGKNEPLEKSSDIDLYYEALAVNTKSKTCKRNAPVDKNNDINLYFKDLDVNTKSTTCDINAPVDKSSDIDLYSEDLDVNTKSTANEPMEQSSDIDLYSEAFAMTRSAAVENELLELRQVNERLRQENLQLLTYKQQLSKNISSLFLTAKQELQEKETKIAELLKIIERQQKSHEQSIGKTDTQSRSAEKPYSNQKDRYDRRPRKIDSNEKIPFSEHRRSEGSSHPSSQSSASLKRNRDGDFIQRTFEAASEEKLKYKSSRSVNDKKAEERKSDSFNRSSSVNDKKFEDRKSDSFHRSSSVNDKKVEDRKSDSFYRSSSVNDKKVKDRKSDSFHRSSSVNDKKFEDRERDSFHRSSSVNDKKFEDRKSDSFNRSSTKPTNSSSASKLPETSVKPASLCKKDKVPKGTVAESENYVKINTHKTDLGDSSQTIHNNSQKANVKDGVKLASASKPSQDNGIIVKPVSQCKRIQLPKVAVEECENKVKIDTKETDPKDSSQAKHNSHNANVTDKIKQANLSKPSQETCSIVKTMSLCKKVQLPKVTVEECENKMHMDKKETDPRDSLQAKHNSHNANVKDQMKQVTPSKLNQDTGIVVKPGPHCKKYKVPKVTVAESENKVNLDSKETDSRDSSQAKLNSYNANLKDHIKQANASKPSQETSSNVNHMSLCKKVQLPKVAVKECENKVNINAKETDPRDSSQAKHNSHNANVKDQIKQANASKPNQDTGTFIRPGSVGKKDKVPEGTVAESENKVNLDSKETDSRDSSQAKLNSYNANLKDHIKQANASKPSQETSSNVNHMSLCKKVQLPKVAVKECENKVKINAKETDPRDSSQTKHNSHNANVKDHIKQANSFKPSQETSSIVKLGSVCKKVQLPKVVVVECNNYVNIGTNKTFPKDLSQTKHNSHNANVNEEVKLASTSKPSQDTGTSVKPGSVCKNDKVPKVAVEECENKVDIETKETDHRDSSQIKHKSHNTNVKDQIKQANASKPCLKLAKPNLDTVTTKINKSNNEFQAYIVDSKKENSKTTLDQAFSPIKLKSSNKMASMKTKKDVKSTNDECQVRTNSSAIKTCDKQAAGKGKSKNITAGHKLFSTTNVCDNESVDNGADIDNMYDKDCFINEINNSELTFFQGKSCPRDEVKHADVDCELETASDNVNSMPQTSFITCTSNLILLGDEESCQTMSSPNKFQPSEFYPPGVRGNVRECGSHARHIRGFTEFISKIPCGVNYSFQDEQDNTVDAFNNMQGNIKHVSNTLTETVPKKKRKIDNVNTNCLSDISSSQNSPLKFDKKHKSEGHLSKVEPSVERPDGSDQFRNDKLLWASAVKNTFGDVFNKMLQEWKLEK